MSEMSFNSMQELFNHLHSRGGANATVHGALGTFYNLMLMYTNPHTCSCKKGKNALNNIFNTCKACSELTGEVLTNCKAKFDNNTVIVHENGTEVVRF